MMELRNTSRGAGGGNKAALWPCGHPRTVENTQSVGSAGVRCRECRKRISREYDARVKRLTRVSERDLHYLSCMGVTPDAEKLFVIPDAVATPDAISALDRLTAHDFDWKLSSEAGA